jgi:hypothetical protein
VSLQNGTSIRLLDFLSEVVGAHERGEPQPAVEHDLAKHDRQDGDGARGGKVAQDASSGGHIGIVIRLDTSKVLENCVLSVRMARMSEATAFRWFHTLLAYGLACGIVYYMKSSAGIALFAPFLFSAIMCRAASFKDLAAIAGGADDILKKLKPGQKALDLDAGGQ